MIFYGLVGCSVASYYGFPMQKYNQIQFMEVKMCRKEKKKRANREETNHNHQSGHYQC